MSEKPNAGKSSLPTIEAATDAFFNDFDFGEGSGRTRLSYRSGARAFIGFLINHDDLDPSLPIDKLPSSVSADFNAWMQSAEHAGPCPDANDGDRELQEGYSASTRKLYLQALSRLLRF